LSWVMAGRAANGYASIDRLGILLVWFGFVARTQR
jgi:hypothetical protein